jgi:hypothetical protein
MLAAVSFHRDKFQAKSLARLITPHHGLGSYGAFLHQEMQIGHLTFRKGFFRFQKHSARAYVANARHVRARNALPVNPNVAACFESRCQSSARTYADQTFLPQGWPEEIVLLEKSKILPAKT